MDMRFIVITIGTWFIFMVLAIINAGLRNGVYKPLIGDLRAHQLSTLIFIMLILIVTYSIFRFSNASFSTEEAFIIGGVWLLLTICFEFLAGHFLFGNPWDRLIADYNIFQGRVWVFVLVTLFISPYLMSRIV